MLFNEVTEVNIKRCWRKRRQRRRGFKSLFKKVKGADKKAARSDIGKLVLWKGLEHLPRLAKGVSIIKNKSQIAAQAHSLVNMGVKTLSPALLSSCKYYCVEKKLQKQINLLLIKHKSVHVHP